MAQVLTSISGIQISAASAGFAPTNGADVSAIASAYQVVSATATQLYAGTAHVTSVNSAPLSASRAGNAANASMATSAYYDGTGRLISSLPDAVTVSAIASSYADDKLDKTAEVVTATAGDGTYVTSINGMGISGQGGGIDSATCSAIASSYAESAVSSKLDTSAQVVTATAGDGTYVTSINGMGLSGQGGGGGGAAFPAEINYGGNVRAVVTTGFQDNTATRPTLFISSNPAYNSYPRMMLSENHATTGKSGAFLADAFEFYTGTGVKVFRADTTSVSGANFSLTKGLVNGLNWSLNSSYVTGGNNTSNWLLNKNLVSGMAGTATWEYGTAEYNKLTSVHDTVSANSASWGGGGGGASLPITGSAGDDTATYGVTGIEFTRNDTAGEPDIRTATLSPDQFYIDYTLDGIDHTSMMLTESMLDFGDSDGDHIVDAYSIDSWNSAVDTVSNNSASWGQGGVDSATVSAIASSYAESAVSSKLDTTAQVVTSTASAYDMDGYAWTTEINGLEISAAKAYSASYANTAETAYSADFASSSDKATYDTDGRFLSSLTDSATVSAIASSYAESAVSSKLDTTAQVVSATAGDGTYVTSINGMGISGQGGGGAQVVTATGSASANAGSPFFPLTYYLVSSINGSAILPYGFSSLSANSAKWISTNSAVSANSANWNSAYSLISGVTALLDSI